MIDPKLGYSFADRPGVTSVAEGKAPNTSVYAGACLPIAQPCEPLRIAVRLPYFNQRYCIL
jgi:hypothetical protein